MEARWRRILFASVALAVSASSSVATAQSASVVLRARTAAGLSVAACRGDRLTSWSIAAGADPAVEWELSARCALGSVTALSDGGVLYIDRENPALVRVSSAGVERYRQPLGSPAWGAPRVLGAAIVLRTSSGTVEWRALEDGALQLYRRTEAASDRRALLTAGAPWIVRQREGERVCVATDLAIECWRASDGLSMNEFAQRSRATISARPLAVDLDRDGDDELIVARTDGTVSAVDRLGSTRWTVASPTRALVTEQPVAFYLAGSLRLGWTDMDRWVSVVAANNGAMIEGFARRAELVSRAGLRVADVDGDGEADLVVSARTGALFAFRARDGSSVPLRDSGPLPASLEGEPVLAVSGDGAVQWFALDGERALAQRSFSPSALRESDALLVAQPDERPRLPPQAGTAITVIEASAAVVAPASTTAPTPTPVAPPALGCTTSPASRSRGGATAALLGAVAALLSRRRARR